MEKVIHVTERSTFKQCRRLWDYQYKQGLQHPTDRIDARWIGKGVHFALAEYYRGNDWKTYLDGWFEIKIEEHVQQTPLTADTSAKIEEIKTLVNAMLKGYELYAEEKDDFEVIGTEIALSVPIPGTDGGFLAGTIDMIVRRHGKLWVFDHKTFASFADPVSLELDDQMTAYLWLVWRTYGEMPAGAVYNQLRKKIPAEPMLLKDGTRLSKDKSIDTTTAKYLEAINRNGFNPDDYEDILDKISLNEFFRREVIPRNPHELETFEEFLTFECLDMINPMIPLYPNATRDCTYCDYQTLCKSQNEKGDTESLKNNLYVVDFERRL